VTAPRRVTKLSGSIIGIKTTHKYLEKTQSYVRVGQNERQKRSYDFVLKEAENLRIKKYKKQ
jgi:hypothetical protein